MDVNLSPMELKVVCSFLIQTWILHLEMHRKKKMRYLLRLSLLSLDYDLKYFLNSNKLFSCSSPKQIATNRMCTSYSVDVDVSFDKSFRAIESSTHFITHTLLQSGYSPNKRSTCRNLINHRYTLDYTYT